MQCFMLMHLERVTNGKIRVEYVVGIFDEFVYMEVIVQCESDANHLAPWRTANDSRPKGRKSG